MNCTFGGEEGGTKFPESAAYEVKVSKASYATGTFIDRAGGR